MNKIANWWRNKKGKNQFSMYVAILFQWITEWMCFYGMFFFCWLCMLMSQGIVYVEGVKNHWRWHDRWFSFNMQNIFSYTCLSLVSWWEFNSQTFCFQSPLHVFGCKKFFYLISYKICTCMYITHVEHIWKCHRHLMPLTRIHCDVSILHTKYSRNVIQWAERIQLEITRIILHGNFSNNLSLLCVCVCV